MPDCKYCGKSAGILADEHEWCREAKEAGRLDEYLATLNAPKAVGPLTAVRMFWVIFGALWAFSLTAGLLYALIRAISS